MKREGTHLTFPEYAISFSLTSSNEPRLPLRLQSGTRTAAWVSVGLMGYFVVYAAENISFIVLREG